MGGGGAFEKPIKILQKVGAIKPVPKPVAAPKPAPKPVAPAPAPQPITPTAAEVSQSEATAADGMRDMSRKVKRRGRSATILTSSTGVDESVTLGTKSLLGG
jgi:hypothetical protein